MKWQFIPVNKYCKKQTLKKIPNIIRVRGVLEIKVTSKQYSANETAINNLYSYLHMYIEYVCASLTRWYLKNNRKCSLLGTLQRNSNILSKC